MGVIQFYFDKSDPSNQTADDVIRSLVKQSVYQLNNKDVPEALGQLYDKETRLGKAATPSMAEITGLLGQCLEKFDIVYICIDALDECAPDQAIRILKGLQTLPSQKYRLFVTGRTYTFDMPEIRDDHDTEIWLRNAKYQPISALRKDIESYLNDKLQPSSARPYLEKIRPRIVEAIASQSNGQYTPFKTRADIDSYLHAFN